jgi:hypothetical protein
MDHFNLFVESFKSSQMFYQGVAKITKSNMKGDKRVKSLVKMVRESKEKNTAIHTMKRIWDEGEAYVVSLDPPRKSFGVAGEAIEVHNVVFVKHDGEEGFKAYECSSDGYVFNSNPVFECEEDEVEEAIEHFGYKFVTDGPVTTVQTSGGEKEDSVADDDDDEEENTDTPEPEDDDDDEKELLNEKDEDIEEECSKEKK